MGGFVPPLLRRRWRGRTSNPWGVVFTCHKNPPRRTVSGGEVPDFYPPLPLGGSTGGSVPPALALCAPAWWALCPPVAFTIHPFTFSVNVASRLIAAEFTRVG